jgi:sec-independent protein translocase protein TatB
MFDIGWTEILLIAVVAVVVVGPKELPRVLVSVGRWVTKGRALAREFQDGVQTVMREAELDELRIDLPDPAKILGDNPLAKGKPLVGGPKTVPEEQFLDDQVIAEMEKADAHTAELLHHAAAQQLDTQEKGPEGGPEEGAEDGGAVLPPAPEPAPEPSPKPPSKPESGT